MSAAMSRMRRREEPPKIQTCRPALRLLKEYADKDKAKVLRRFFKTGPGEYGEGDIFIGVTVPRIRWVARLCSSMPFTEISALLSSPIHEERLLALFILVQQFNNGGAELRGKIFKFYLARTKFVNSWDLVDASADKIVGAFLADRPRDRLFRLARSPVLWERRIAIIATFHFIKAYDFDDALDISEMLLNDSEELIHKAVGWMLREIGKRNQRTAEEFLKRHCRQMPRITLRYAIERFGEPKRRFYLKQKAGG